MGLKHRLHNLRRRVFGSWSIDDPRPIQADAPYTYFLPSAERIAALLPGDLVKLVIRSHPPGPEWDAERMWAEVKNIAPEGWTGALANTPCDMPQLREGSRLTFQPFHIIDLIYEGDREAPPGLPRREYWDRCMVDSCVLDEGVPVYYIYRDEPDMGDEDDKYPDSGWRIRGDYRDLNDEQLHARKHDYIAIGKVLNADDSWLHLIDSPVGSAWLRNFETGGYEPLGDEDNHGDN
ncbi:immunity protein Imm33 domain-containing protein [Sphingobium limneticum]|uniref:DUF2185 domain-containing protein n=1 Tax=Sphingobium limneticum TaxID=1007511 RepID=A0A5J5I4B1_9SPHN|nr:DUF2185 domain-containing protein [Sphingobium limneticum]KAA9018242.1 DUF2185 domain-containing protein [Sphingobium limneticum]KAA9030878.1 DUF2185 domain-containing protein [Sphingobium limneticum]